MLATGYLKVISYQTDEESDEGDYPLYQLTLTNEEVRRVFFRMITRWFGEVKGNYNEFIKALLSDDLKAMNGYMKRVCNTVFSYFDTGKGGNGEEPEKFYHGFVLGLIVELSKNYHVRSNRESGFGRYDVMLYPKDVNKGNAVILEFKVHDTEDGKDLSGTVKAALEQIEEKNYSAELVALGFKEENIKKYGFAFKGKEVLIGK